MSREVTLGPGPIVMLDDCAEDLMITRLCLEKSSLDNEFVGFTAPTELLSYLDQVTAGEQAMPGLVLLDINMPLLNGFEVLRRVRVRNEFEHVPVIVMLTNSDNPKDTQKALQLGANAFKTKDSDIQALTSFFDRLVG